MRPPYPIPPRISSLAAPTSQNFDFPGPRKGFTQPAPEVDRTRYTLHPKLETREDRGAQRQMEGSPRTARKERHAQHMHERGDLGMRTFFLDDTDEDERQQHDPHPPNWPFRTDDPLPEPEGRAHYRRQQHPPERAADSAFNFSRPLDAQSRRSPEDHRSPSPPLRRSMSSELFREGQRPPISRSSHAPLAKERSPSPPPLRRSMSSGVFTSSEPRPMIRSQRSVAYFQTPPAPHSSPPPLVHRHSSDGATSSPAPPRKRKRDVLRRLKARYDRHRARHQSALRERELGKHSGSGSESEEELRSPYEPGARWE
ncbi:hypothetical protein JCM10207_007125 [Rhodosporidiobolus poonsookiae]